MCVCVCVYVCVCVCERERERERERVFVWFGCEFLGYEQNLFRSKQTKNTKIYFWIITLETINR